MSIARKCDRCGKFYEYYSTDTNGKQKYNAIKRALYTVNGDLSRHGLSIDLCPECMNKFDMFIKGCEIFENMEVNDNGRRV